MATITVVVAVLWRRPDLLVVATPLAAVAGWSALMRPTNALSVSDRIGNPVVREGDGTTWYATVDGSADRDGIADAGDGRLDLVAAVLPDGVWLQSRPTPGVAVAAHDGTAAVSVVLRSTRWGRHATPSAQIVGASCWAAFRCSATTAPHQLTVLPLPAVFDTDTSFRPSRGLVGVHRSTRPGEGGEFAGIRPFHRGDRLRRIHWPTSLRTGELHVSATWADQDTHVVLILDTSEEVGISDGIDGVASSLDTTVRAAGAIAQHYARRGDRVSLRVLGGPSHLDVPPATGRPQLRRILDALTHVKPARRTVAGYSTGDRRRTALGGDALAIMLSPLITPDALDRAVALGRHGVAVAVVDTLPPDVVVDDDPHTALAWRIRLLERRRELRAVAHAGIPVIPWRGPGSLDQFLRALTRRAHAPRTNSR